MIPGISDVLQSTDLMKRRTVHDGADKVAFDKDMDQVVFWRSGAGDRPGRS
jgi:hypothetical protein